MNAIRAFLPLIGRASVIWLSIVAVCVVTIIVSGLSKPDRLFADYVDATFAAAFLFPAAAGWVAGAVVQEFQHTSFAMFLPGVRVRLAVGFAIAGLLVTGTIVGLIALMDPSPHNLLVLFAVGIGGYGLGSSVIDSGSNWAAALLVILVLAVIINSGELQRLTNAYPTFTCILTLALSVMSVNRQFSRSSFRTKPFRPATPLPGRFSFEKSRENHRRRLTKAGPLRSTWRKDYLGNDTWRWTRAAVHETYGSNFARSILKSVARAWPLGLVFLAGAWLDKGDMSFTEALAWSVNDALLRSPFQPQFGEHGGPFPLVMIVIAAIGAVTALFSSVALNESLVYPLSRLQRAVVQFRGGLVDAAILLLIIAPSLLIIGQVTGWSLGFETRLDFMPYFLRVLLVTLALMPLAYRGRLQLQLATWRKAENNMVMVIIGITGFVALVAILTAISGALLTSPVVELTVLTVVILASRFLYWRSLVNFYTSADLS